MLSGLLKRTKWNLIIAVPLLPLALAERLISTAFLLFTEVTKQQLYILAAPNLWDDSNLRNLCVSTLYMYHYLSLFCTLRFLHSSLVFISYSHRPSHLNWIVQQNGVSENFMLLFQTNTWHMWILGLEELIFVPKSMHCKFAVGYSLLRCFSLYWISQLYSIVQLMLEELYKRQVVNYWN